jgi:hypothetical protein
MAAGERVEKYAGPLRSIFDSGTLATECRNGDTGAAQLLRKRSISSAV